MNIGYTRLNSSFRDTDGFVFSDENKTVYRQLNHSYKEHYLLLKTSGLYQHLVNKKMLIPHQEIDNIIFEYKNHFKTLLPQQVSFISYPYEWCFDQLKDAALLTLELMKQSLNYGMILKDATPFNIQFQNGKCIFIDTSSFEKYVDGTPWIAYRQFCECFLAPLVLSHYSGNDLNKILATFPDGIPLNIVSKLLPFKSKFKISVLLHIHFQAAYKKQISAGKKYSLSKKKLFVLIDNLQSLVKNITLKNSTTAWANYYSETVLSNEYLASKKQIIENILDKLTIKTALDLGSNNGYFSEVLANKNIEVVSADFDLNCINSIYNNCKIKNILNILPVVLDVANPTPAIGWQNSERHSFLHRADFDLTIALALVHHLAVAKNIPFDKIAEMFSSLGKFLIVEFVPKNDGKVQLLLQNRKDVFTDYCVENFETAFLKYFTLSNKKFIKNTERIIYLFEKKKG